MSNSESPYLTGNFGPVAEESTVTNLRVTGELPIELEGRWLRNGPNPVGDVDPTTHHWFLGDGMVHGIRLRSGRAEWYRNRWVRSGPVAAALGEDPPPGVHFGGRDFGPNTSVGAFAGRTWAFVEGGASPVELGYELDTVGVNRFDGTLAAGFSAHPKYDPRSGELHAVCYAYPDLLDRVQYVIVGPDGRVTRTMDIPIEGMPIIHDMSLTEHWAVVFDLSVTVDIDMVGTSPFPLRWNPDHGARVGMVPRAPTASTADIIWCEVDPCYLFHPVNAYEDDDGKVVIDSCRYERLFDTDGRGPFGDGGTTLDRWTIDPVRARVVEDRILDRSVEFPRHDPRVATRRHRWAYVASLADNRVGFGPTLKVDCEAGTVVEHDWGMGRAAEEPIFVPRAEAEAEDDGWLMIAVYDAATDKSELCILDATDVAATPVATVSLPTRIPHGFHGNWVPDPA